MAASMGALRRRSQRDGTKESAARKRLARPAGGAGAQAGALFLQYIAINRVGGIERMVFAYYFDSEEPPSSFAASSFGGSSLGF